MISDKFVVVEGDPKYLQVGDSWRARCPATTLAPQHL
jgi:hypothetical protein